MTKHGHSHPHRYLPLLLSINFAFVNLYQCLSLMSCYHSFLQWAPACISVLLVHRFGQMLYLNKCTAVVTWQIAQLWRCLHLQPIYRGDRNMRMVCQSSLKIDHELHN